MGRKSAKGKTKTCKALENDGTRCNKTFTCNMHRSGDHKFCSKKCQNRDLRLKKAKKARAEAKKLKKQEKEMKLRESVHHQIEEVYREFRFSLNQLDKLTTPIIQIPRKSFIDDEFRVIGGSQNHQEYEAKRLHLENEERKREFSLKINFVDLKRKLKLGAENFGQLYHSNELRLPINDRIRATSVDMRVVILDALKKHNIEVPIKIKRQRYAAPTAARGFVPENS